MKKIIFSFLFIILNMGWLSAQTAPEPLSITIYVSAGYIAIYIPDNPSSVSLEYLIFVDGEGMQYSLSTYPSFSTYFRNVNINNGPVCLLIFDPTKDEVIPRNCQNNDDNNVLIYRQTLASVDIFWWIGGNGLIPFIITDELDYTGICSDIRCPLEYVAPPTPLPTVTNTLPVFPTDIPSLVVTNTPHPFIPTQLPLPTVPDVSPPTNQSPIIAPTTEPPTNVPTVVPTTEPPTNVPTVVPTTEPPTNQPPIIAPTTEPPTNQSPIIAPTTEPPTIGFSVVTNRQYAQCIYASKCAISDENFRENSQPAVHIPHRQAKNYCEAQGGSLPTQQEWQDAAPHIDHVEGIFYEWIIDESDEELSLVISSITGEVSEPVSTGNVGFRCIFTHFP